jgi:hypothetical protein
MNDLMRGILSESLRDINLEIYNDGFSEESLMYVSSPDHLSLKMKTHQCLRLMKFLI